MRLIIKYSYLVLLLLSVKIYSQESFVNPQANPPSGCSPCRQYARDLDGDHYIAANSFHWFELGTEPDHYIFIDLVEGIDCNDNDPNQTISRYWYLDSDIDTFGGSVSTPTQTCQVPAGHYSATNDDCDDNNAAINPNTPWYKDVDNDGIGTLSDMITSCTKPENYVILSGDICPTAPGPFNPSGCPTEENQSLSNENYVYTRTFNVPTPDLSLQIPAVDMLESITYIDGLGREKQKIEIRAGGQGQDIITPILYDDYGRTPKSYLPYANSSSLNGAIILDPITDLNAFYYTSKYELTQNPYVNTSSEKSSLERTIEVGAPGINWEIPTNGAIGHTIKYEYKTNIQEEVRKFDVVFKSGTSEDHYLRTNGFYAPSKLYKKIIKNENWTGGSTLTDQLNNTTQEFIDNEGHTVLKRMFNKKAIPNTNNFVLEAFNTYYIYDIYGNLSYVIPPLASDEIDAHFQTQTSLNRSYTWTKMAQVDGALAEEYEKLFMEYRDESLANADLYNKFGGQGGFSLTTDSNNALLLNVNITTQEPLELRQGEIVSLSEIGSFRDTELARISGPDYEYIFYIRNNSLVVDGRGKVSSVIINSTANTKLIYNKNYSWSEVVDIPATGSNNSQPGNGDSNGQSMTGNTNSFNSVSPVPVATNINASGGVTITIDENDVVSMALNITSDTPIHLKKGIVVPLNTERRMIDSDLGTMVGSTYNYHFYIKENSLYIEGVGDFTSASKTPVNANGPGPVVLDLDVPLDIIEGLCYVYHYDYRNRMVEKKIPGKGWQYLVYDKLNRPVITQDASLRTDNSWLFAKYDALNRIIYNGEFKYVGTLGNSNSALRKEIQNTINGNGLLYETFTATSPFMNGGIAINYSNANFPQDSSANTAITDFTILTVNYFDNYNFSPYGVTPVLPQSSYNSTTNNILTNVRSLSTGSLVRVLHHNDWIFNLNAYDDKARLVWSKAKNSYLKTDDIVEMQLDFLGNVLKSKTDHSKSGITTNLVTVDSYDYDHSNRMLKHTQQVANQGEELITFNQYDELGKLVSNKVGGVAPSAAIAFSQYNNAIQAIDYSYNVRGWLKEINDPDAPLTDKLFAFKINYDESLPGVTPLFNGNISQTSWKTSADNVLRKYNYIYDSIDRLTDANYPTINNNNLVEDYSENNIKYDKNGNIYHLERYGLKGNNTVIDKIDALDYSYDPKSNRLLNVTDTSRDVAGFKGDSDYGYDINGNMIADSNKKITLVYNYLNLPEKIVVDNQDPDVSTHPNGILYVYDALGNKLEKSIVKTRSDESGGWLPPSIVTIDYAGNYIYKDNILQSYSQPEGYVSYTNGTFEYIYQFKDHLGNVRLSYKKDATGTIQIIEENNFYPFGLKHKGYNNLYNNVGNDQAQKYKYNGKELQQEFGINLYDYDARNYDPSTGRWLNIDPVADSYRSNSPYTYALNNPIYFIDSDGYRPTPHEAALMAAYSYGGKAELKTTKWSVSGININLSSSGLKGTLFQKVENGITEYAFAFAGTDTDGLINAATDIREDLLQIIGLSKQYPQAIGIAKVLSKALRGHKLEFIGHSLGGGLATVASLVTGRSATTFNSAWISNGMKLPKVPLLKGNSRDNYVNPFDPVTNFQKATRFLEVLSENAIEHKVELENTDSLNPLDYHSINMLIDATDSEETDSNAATTNRSTLPPLYNPAYSKTGNIQRNIKKGERGNNELNSDETYDD